jgi:hypothetical protein
MLSKKKNKQSASTSCRVRPADGEEAGEIRSGEGEVGTSIFLPLVFERRIPFWQ